MTNSCELRELPHASLTHSNSSGQRECAGRAGSMTQDGSVPVCYTMSTAADCVSGGMAGDTAAAGAGREQRDTAPAAEAGHEIR
jgi:hypothetical protein